MANISITIGLRYETDKAICVSSDGDEAIWLPKSQVEFAEVGNGQVEVTLPYWLACEKGLDDA